MVNENQVQPIQEREVIITNNVYAIKDKKVGFQVGLYCKENDEAMCRDMQIAVNSGAGLLSTNSEDFALYKIGTFDSKGNFIVGDLVKVCECMELKKKPANAVPYPVESEVK